MAEAFTWGRCACVYAKISTRGDAAGSNRRGFDVNTGPFKHVPHSFSPASFTPFLPPIFSQVGAFYPGSVQEHLQVPRARDGHPERVRSSVSASVSHVVSIQVALSYVCACKCASFYRSSFLKKLHIDFPLLLVLFSLPLRLCWSFVEIYMPVRFVCCG